jgi:hypothetical protein
MRWDYRIIRTEKAGEEYFGIHEVFYPTNNRPTWVSNPALCYVGTVHELQAHMAEMGKAFDRPVLQTVGDSLIEWKPK